MSNLFEGAPEGTTHFGPEDGSFVAAWLKIDGATQEYICLDEGGRWKNYTGGIPNHRFNMLIERQKPKSWSGPEDGLPPIGSHVMVHECSHEYTKQFNDQTVRIVAHDEGKYAVFAADNFVYHALVAEKFKLPPTPEQLAAEEREISLKEMTDICIKASMKGVDAVAALYDAGFKREVK